MNVNLWIWGSKASLTLGVNIIVVGCQFGKNWTEQLLHMSGLQNFQVLEYIILTA